MPCARYKITSVFLLIIFLCTCVDFTNAQPGPKFKSVVIGKQVWMNENATLVRFRNGDPIQQAQSDSAWQMAGFHHLPAWCYHEEDPKNGTAYGILYNRYAVSDPRGLAPAGWHIPDEAEWNELINYLGGDSTACLKLKAKNGWQETPSVQNNASGFNALPAGWRDVGFGGFGSSSGWWYNKAGNNDYGYTVHLNADYYKVVKGQTSWMMGYSLRCVKD